MDNGFRRNLTAQSAENGFTIVELLVTIAIVAILAVATIVLLNPGEMLRQTRDSNRVADLATMKTAIVTYIADVGQNAYLGAANTCYAHPSSTLTDCSARFSATGVPTRIASRKVDGTGWIPVNFTAMSTKPPVSVLPLDPVNNATFFYAYKVDPVQLLFKLDAKMESEKYSHGGSGDVESRDGGINPDLFETGTDVTL